MPKNCYTHMSVEERETLSLELAQGHSLRAMATVLGRALSNREPRTHPQREGPPVSDLHGAESGGGPGASAPATAHTRGLLAGRYVRTQLARGCSPEQIAGRLRHEYPDDMRKHLILMCTT